MALGFRFRVLGFRFFRVSLPGVCSHLLADAMDSPPARAEGHDSGKRGVPQGPEYQSYPGLARNGGMDPDSNPSITHYNSFHVFLHSFSPSYVWQQQSEQRAYLLLTDSRFSTKFFHMSRTHAFRTNPRL